MPRISSVDAVRGLAMLCILSGPSVAYAIKALGDARGGVTEAVGRFAGKQFSHAPWAGLRFYDLLFPIFIFTVGVSIALSLAKPGVNEQRRAVYWRVVRRSSALFALGVIAYGGLPVEHWSDVRLMGVLQRIALCYLLTSLLFLHVGAPGLIGVTVFLLAGYWALLAFMTLPQAVGNPYGSEQNLAIWIDQQFLPGRKLFGNWDPEGLLSTLPAIATCLFGALTGMLLLAKALTPTQKSVATIVAGSMAVVAGELWGLQFPIIKNIWTSSYVLVTAGYSMILLGLVHQVMDVWRVTGWAAIFIWAGTNAIVLYLLDGLIGFAWLGAMIEGGLMRLFEYADFRPLRRLAASVIGLTLILTLAGILYRYRIFLRV